MDICDKQHYSFNRNYKYERSNYYTQKNITNVHAVGGGSHP